MGKLFYVLVFLNIKESFFKKILKKKYKIAQTDVILCELISISIEPQMNHNSTGEFLNFYIF